MTLSVEFMAKCSMLFPAVIYQIITCDPLFSPLPFLFVRWRRLGEHTGKQAIRWKEPKYVNAI